MGGPRVTSGEDSKQDYATPPELMAAVVRRFGPISFDLAAHSSNKKHPRYFAPPEFVTRGTAEELGLSEGEDLPPGVAHLKKNKNGIWLYERRVKNDDPEAFAFDSLKQDWAEISARFGSEHPSGRALGWDNCEWADVDPWAAKHLAEMLRGANTLLLTPAVITNWYRDNIAGQADCYDLLGRISFDGKNVYGKDCMISHFWPGADGRKVLWDWRRDEICGLWMKAAA